MKRLGKFERKLKTKSILELPLSELQIGVNTFKDVFICLDKNRKVRYVVNRTCDHNGGKLIRKGDCAVCPMHGWELNLATLEYNDSHIEKKQLPYSVKEGKLIITIKEYKIVNPFLRPTQDKVFFFRWLNHATMYFEFAGYKIATDPWLFGPAFMNGWWLKSPSTKDSVQLIKNSDLIYISHNHPDHLHPETLSVLSKNIPVITGKFQSSSSKKMLERSAFTNVTELEFNDIFELENGIQVSVLKSGDFRDDSGLYLVVDGKEILLTVDANFLNAFELPENIFLLATSFSGGATGFPLCFINYSEDDKLEIINRNRVSMKAKITDVVKIAKPKYYMPYAGMFGEYASRDKYIQDNNLKNQVDDYLFLENKMDLKLLRPDNKVNWTVDGNRVVKSEIEVDCFEKENTGFYISKYKQEYQWDDEKIIVYFKQSGFHSNILLQIVPADDIFNPVGDHHIFADFYKDIFQVKPNNEMVENLNGYRVETIFARREAFMSVVENKLPWEDISIGFQIRVKRNPNHYNSDFWYHFTNVNISGENYRHSVYCGACTVVEQNPIWNRQAAIETVCIK